jgi:hypothetical protein
MSGGSEYNKIGTRFRMSSVANQVSLKQEWSEINIGRIQHEFKKALLCFGRRVLKAQKQ